MIGVDFVWLDFQSDVRGLTVPSKVDLTGRSWRGLCTFTKRLLFFCLPVQMPKVQYRSNCKPSTFAYPPALEVPKEKEKEKVRTSAPRQIGLFCFPFSEIISWGKPTSLHIDLWIILNPPCQTHHFLARSIYYFSISGLFFSDASFHNPRCSWRMKWKTKQCSVYFVVD